MSADTRRTGLASSAVRLRGAVAPALLAVPALLASAVPLASAMLLASAVPLAPAAPLAAPASAGSEGVRASDEPVRPGAWNPRRPPPGWVVVETEHYQVQSQIGEDQARALGEHLERMLALYEEVLPFRRKVKTFVLKIFAGRDAMRAYGGADEDTAAWYDKTHRELVAYDSGLVFGRRTVPVALRLGDAAAARLSDADRLRVAELCERATDAFTFDVARVLSHEGWHQYFHHYTVSWVPMPAWLDEGVGDYFFTAQRRPGGEGYDLGALNHHRLRVVRRALEEGTTVPFAELLGYEQDDYSSNASVYYAQGWSMVHFLMEHPDPEHRAVIPRLIEDFKDTKNFAKSSLEAFRKLDLDELDAQWRAWLRATEPDDPLMTLAEDLGARVAPEDLVGQQRLVDWYRWARDQARRAPSAGRPAPAGPDRR